MPIVATVRTRRDDLKKRRINKNSTSATKITAATRPIANDNTHGNAHDDVMHPYANAVGTVPRSACAKLITRFGALHERQTQRHQRTQHAEHEPEQPHTRRERVHDQLEDDDATAGAYGASGASDETVGRLAVARAAGRRLGRDRRHSAARGPTALVSSSETAKVFPPGRRRWTARLSPPDALPYVIRYTDSSRPSVARSWAGRTAASSDPAGPAFRGYLRYAMGVTSGVNLERSARSPALSAECSKRILAVQRPAAVWAERSDPTLNPQVPGSNPGGRTISICCVTTVCGGCQADAGPLSRCSTPFGTPGLRLLTVAPEVYRVAVCASPCANSRV